eukprot:scaffold24941_cov51-Attheya_sp.AAC.3
MGIAIISAGVRLFLDEVSASSSRVCHDRTVFGFGQGSGNVPGRRRIMFRSSIVLMAPPCCGPASLPA